MRALLLIPFIILACKNTEPGPSPTPIPTATPTSTPSPTATPTPSPSPSPVPTATPSPTATPGFSCQLPKQHDCSKDAKNCCSKGGTDKYNGMIYQAQDELAKTNPSYFNSDGSLAVSEVEYTKALAETFERLFNICAIGGGTAPLSEDEIGIKETNASAVHIDVIIGGSSQPWVGGAYTCSPSAF